MYEIYCKLRDEKGVKDADVARGTGIGKSTFSDWKSGRSAPKNEKLFKIAEYFGVPADVFGVNNTVEFDAKKIIRAYHKNESYYENEETARLAQEALEDSDMRINCLHDSADCFAFLLGLRFVHHLMQPVHRIACSAITAIHPIVTVPV